MKSLTESPVKSASIANSKSTTAPNYISIPAFSHTFTLALAFVLASISTKELFKQFIKVYQTFIKVLEQNREQA